LVLTRISHEEFIRVLKHEGFVKSPDPVIPHTVFARDKSYF